MTSHKRNAPEIVAEICLYGNHQTGAGYLATIEDRAGLLGTGEPVPGRSFTGAVWLAVEEIWAQEQSTAFRKGHVRIFAAGGQMFADAPLAHVPAFGDLEWVRYGLKERAWAL